MKNFDKYERQYFLPPVCEYDWAKKDYIEKAPIWCSVDLRDGNQALIEPMSLDEKLEFFQMLVDIGFKEIEVGFPAASETEFIFMRTLIERDMIPDDVTVQVLTQAREHIIKKTFEAVKGAPHAVIHLYNSTSVAQREQVFKKDKEHIMQLAVDGAKLLKRLASETEGDFSFEYIKIKMKDGTYLDGKDFQAGGSEDYDKERQQLDFVIEFSIPIDISQVELVVIGNERFPMKE